MEFYAQELWIFLIYNIRGSLLSCLLLRLTGPRPHTHSLCPPHPCPPALPAQGAPSGSCWVLGLCVDRNNPKAVALVSELTVASWGRWLPGLSNLGFCASLRPAASCAQASLFALTEQSQKQSPATFLGRGWRVGVCERIAFQKNR